MAVINTGLAPKALAGGLAGSEGMAVSPVQQASLQGRQQAQRQSNLLRAITRAARNRLAGHNDGGMAYHDGSAMAHPCGKR